MMNTARENLGDSECLAEKVEAQGCSIDSEIMSADNIENKKPMSNNFFMQKLLRLFGNNQALSVWFIVVMVHLPAFAYTIDLIGLMIIWGLMVFYGLLLYPIYKKYQNIKIKISHKNFYLMLLVYLTAIHIFWVILGTMMVYFIEVLAGTWYHWLLFFLILVSYQCFVYHIAGFIMREDK